MRAVALILVGLKPKERAGDTANENHRLKTHRFELLLPLTRRPRSTHSYRAPWTELLEVGEAEDNGGEDRRSSQLPNPITVLKQADSEKKRETIETHHRGHLLPISIRSN